MLLHATACACKSGCFDYIKNSEWSCTLGGHAEMLHALKKGPAHTAYCGMQEARKVKSPLHPPFDCHMLSKRLSPLLECRCQDFGYILHLLTSRIFFNSFSFHPSSPFTLIISVPPPDTHIFLAHNWSRFPCASANVLLFLKSQFFQYWADSSSLTHFFSNILGFMISVTMKGSKSCQVIFHERED